MGGARSQDPKPRGENPADQPEGWADPKGASCLPGAIYDTGDAQVENALSDTVLAIFRAHLTIEPQMARSEAAAETCEENLRPEELAETFRRLAAMGPVPAPDLLAGFDQERTWILLDLSVQGAGLARQRATAELRQTVCQQWHKDSMDLRLLETLAQLLKQACAREGAPALIRALALTANDALRGRHARAKGKGGP
ncbi:MAG: hypothetical protein IT458_08565 [Planctomycetes bacterium]|nr:hypothetical protein [Planctomycetota bacterium]